MCPRSRWSRLALYVAAPERNACVKKYARVRVSRHDHSRTKAAAVVSGHLDIVVLQRERADALARGLEIGIEYRGRRHADRRLANAAPRGSAARRHDDRFDLGHFGDAHRVVGVEI